MTSPSNQSHNQRSGNRALITDFPVGIGSHVMNKTNDEDLISAATNGNETDVAALLMDDVVHRVTDKGMMFALAWSIHNGHSSITQRLAAAVLEVRGVS